MKLALTAKPPSIIHAINTDVREASRTETPEPNSNFNFSTSDGTVAQQTSQYAEVSTVHHEAVESRDYQISCHTALHESSLQGMQNWQEEVKLSGKYS